MIHKVVHRLSRYGKDVPAVRGTMEKVFPEHWSFLLGEIALYSFVVLLGTGIFLVFHFVPSSEPTTYTGSYAPLHGTRMPSAYASTVELSFDVRAGLLARQMHHWAAVVFVAAIVGHLLRVFFTGAFRRPRELNWMVGVSLLFLAMASGYTGYSMLDDVLSRTGLVIGQAIAYSVPVVGAWLGVHLFGGGLPGPDVVPRLYWTHVVVLPVLIFALIGIHMVTLLLQKHTQFRGPGHRQDNVVGTQLWPRYSFETLGLFFGVAAVLAALGGLAQINPVWLYGPWEPGASTPGLQPDWYWGWMDGALRLFPPWELSIAGYTVANAFFPTVLLTLVSFALLYAWPYLEAAVTREPGEQHLLDKPRERPGRTAIGVFFVAFYGVLLVAFANEFIAFWTGASIQAVNAFLRGLLVTLPPVAAAVAWWGSRRRARRLGHVVVREPAPHVGSGSGGGTSSGRS